jgi:hypothetical protein
MRNFWMRGCWAFLQADRPTSLAQIIERPFVHKKIRMGVVFRGTGAVWMSQRKPSGVLAGVVVSGVEAAQGDATGGMGGVRRAFAGSENEPPTSHAEAS